MGDVGITHSLNAACSLPNDSGGRYVTIEDEYNVEDIGVQFLGIAMLDDPATDIKQHFNTAIEFIHTALENNGKSTRKLKGFTEEGLEICKESRFLNLRL